MKELYFGNIRVQFPMEGVVRVEYGKKGKFCDGNTLFVPDRKFPEYNPEVKVTGGLIALGDYRISVDDSSNGLSGLTVYKGGNIAYRYKRAENTGELPPLEKTPQVFPIADNPRITVPDGGYTYRGNVKNSGYVIEENVQDVYLLLCGGDARLLRRLYVSLTGRCELVRLSTLGCWNSKYFVYNEQTAKELICEYEKRGVPLDNMVLDTDWRKASDRGIGYDVDDKLFPDMKAFLDYAHGKGVEIMFNDHPEPVEGADSVLSPEEVRFREEKLKGILDLGVDYWWYDRNWHTKLKSPVRGIEPETMGMHIFADVTENFFKQQAGGKKAHRRPVIMANINNVSNGRYTGKDTFKINDTASHRYSVQWTGDISSDLFSLADEVKTMIKVGNNCIAYANADNGGHFGMPTAEEFVYWTQFGVLSPVYRPHCCQQRNREPWIYGEETFETVLNYINMRYRLLPVIYKNAYENYLTGEPIFKSLGFEYPDDKKALACTTQYMLGNDILIAPYCLDALSPLSKDCFTAPVEAEYFDGMEWKGEPIYRTRYEDLAHYWHEVAPHEGVPVYDFSARFKTTVQVKETTDLFIESDDGVVVWINGEKVLEDYTVHSAQRVKLCTLKPDVPYEVKIDYFQAKGDACIALLGKAVQESGGRKVYLPEGEWVDVFGGKVYKGGKTVIKRCEYKVMPLFVRKGALIPLAYDAKNTKVQKWNNLVYDYYPSKTAEDSGYLYEDDTVTTAYKNGACRTSAYSARYNKATNRYEVTLSKSHGSFSGEKCFKTRKVTLKYHVSCGEKVKEVLVNGESVKFRTHNRDKSAFAFSTGKASDGGTVIVKLKTECDKDYKIEFVI